MKIIKKLEIYKGITKIMKILEIRLRIMKIMQKSQTLIGYSINKNENHRNPYEKYENHENLNVPFEN